MELLRLLVGDAGDDLNSIQAARNVLPRCAAIPLALRQKPTNIRFPGTGYASMEDGSPYYRHLDAVATGGVTGLPRRPK